MRFHKIVSLLDLKDLNRDFLALANKVAKRCSEVLGKEVYVVDNYSIKDDLSLRKNRILYYMFVRDGKSRRFLGGIHTDSSHQRCLGYSLRRELAHLCQVNEYESKLISFNLDKFLPELLDALNLVRISNLRGVNEGVNISSLSEGALIVFKSKETGEYVHFMRYYDNQIFLHKPGTFPADKSSWECVVKRYESDYTEGLTYEVYVNIEKSEEEIHIQRITEQNIEQKGIPQINQEPFICQLNTEQEGLYQEPVTSQLLSG